MKKKSFLLLFLNAIVCVCGYVTSIDIVHKNVRQIYPKTEFRDLYYDDGDDVTITFSLSNLTKRHDQMTLTLVKEDKTKIILKQNTDGWIDFRDILSDSYNGITLVCDIKTEEKENIQLKVHFVRNPSEIERNMQYSGNLFKIILIALGGFIGTSILFMLLIAIYNKFKRKTHRNTPRIPIYEEIIPMKKLKEENEKVDIQDETNKGLSNVYVDSPTCADNVDKT